MDLIDNDIQCVAIHMTSKIPPTFGNFLNYYCIIRLKTVRTKDDIIYLEPGNEPLFKCQTFARS